MYYPVAWGCRIHRMHPFIAIAPRSTQPWRGSTWYGHIYGLNRTNGILTLKWIVWVNWFDWNRKVFDKLYSHLNCLLILNWIIWNGTVFWHWNCIYTKLNCLTWNCFEMLLCVNKIQLAELELNSSKKTFSQTNSTYIYIACLCLTELFEIELFLSLKLYFH